MEPLQPADPSRIAAYRLLGRLGSGGMGVVYLGRTADGALAAVKAIRTDLAEEPGFRARFRREAGLAGRVRSPWVVEVMGADPDAPEPWLATAFVPGAGLDEALAAHGALPPRSVRVLGTALARALTALHAADLVHRDIKPANVLLGVDGPRIIDFGIARAAGDTPLTSADVVIGTPGYLSPEQAEGAPAGPPADVFALGCLLAHAATGRPPFGTGTTEALLFRTVHDAPDLTPAGPADAPDAALVALLRECLAKNPQDRPTARQLADRLGEDVPAGTADWLPDPVVTAVAERAGLLLALPGIEETLADPGAATPPAPGRRRFLTLAGGAALLAAGAGTAAWLTLRDRPAAAPTPAAPAPRRWTIGLQADLSGPEAAAGRAQDRGVRLAAAAFNSRPGKPFTLTVKTVDDQGDPTRSAQATAELLADPDLFAVIGPTGIASVLPVLATYSEASTPLLTVSAAATVYSVAERLTFFQTCPLAMTQYGPANVRMVVGLGLRKLGVLCDRAGDSDATQTAFLMDKAVGTYVPAATAYPRVVAREATDLRPVVTDLLDHRVDGIFYTGSVERAAEIARLLAAARFTGPRTLDYRAAGEPFLAAAGPAAEGWEYFAPYVGPGSPAVTALAAAHRRAHGTEPAPWTAESYDVTLMVAERLAALARGGTRPTRSALVDGLAKGTYKGLTRTYGFDAEGRLSLPDSHRYRIEGGRVRYQGPAPSAPA
ncbi:bifunctional serine/threonine-protein kinase/ABC transporter substrate-binding protein [Streptomyces sp. NPDC097619]|uniref:bifunctional serine/threonine-protein kinase/ABC transporter substrate-binding protein n=1 Tax=Streptomyces sp. NPDC097619 TaxID=3157228 RepID=UPI00331C8FC4